MHLSVEKGNNHFSGWEGSQPTLEHRIYGQTDQDENPYSSTQCLCDPDQVNLITKLSFLSSLKGV